MTLARRTEHVIAPDPSRVLAKLWVPGEELLAGGVSRASLLVQRILDLPESEVVETLSGILADFAGRHHDFERLLERHFSRVAAFLPSGTTLSHERRLLIGAYFTHEYSVEGAALFNPSMVLAPDQAGLLPGQRRFIMSLRAVGEGHISSIEFRSGTLHVEGGITLDPPGKKLVGGHRTAPRGYVKEQFRAKLLELGAGSDIAWGVLARLGETFTPDELERSLELLQSDILPQVIVHETGKLMRVLAASSYLTIFPAESRLDERVLFPAGPNETHGMEDARFVRFVEEDGSVRYYATYTAFDGFEILPQLIETSDFASFAISTLHGSAAQNKGMALFPRRLDGRFVMLSRKDRENLFLATSTDVRSWNEARELHRPVRGWELLQIGNCGSPIETSEGWLVLTHGVGPMRRYAIGALLLDLEDPLQVRGALPVPLITPNESEREGYVPNVAYSCGGVLEGDSLFLPYGFSDHGVRIAVVPVGPLLSQLIAAGT